MSAKKTKKKAATKYADLLELSNQQIKDAARPFEVKKAQKDMEKCLIELEQQEAEIEQQINAAKAHAPINLYMILNYMDELELKKRAIIQTKALKAELF